jgi:hypothetical protein
MKNAANRQSTSDSNEIEALQISRGNKAKGSSAVAGAARVGGVNEPRLADALGAS